MVRDGYKQTEVGVIPVDWEVVTLEEVTTKIGSGKTPTGGKTRYQSAGLTFVRSQNVGWGKMILDDIVYIDEDTHNEFSGSEIEEGDTFLNITGASIGRSAVASTEVYGGNVNQHVCIIRPDNRLNSILLSSFLNSKIGQYQIDSFQAGGNREGLNFKQVRSIQIPLPPTQAEQTAIATALSDTDLLLSALDALIGKKEAFKRGMMERLLGGERRLEGFESSGEFEDKLLLDVVDFIHGKAHEQHIVKQGPYVVVNSKFISTEGAVRKFSDENFCPAQKGDVLTVLSDLPNGKALAKCYYVEEDDKYAVNQRICVWRAKNVDPKYLAYVMNRHKHFLKFDDGVTQTHILNHHIKECPIYLPPTIPEQRAIARVLSDLDAELAGLRARRAKLGLVKGGMMEVLLGGEVRLV